MLELECLYCMMGWEMHVVLLGWILSWILLMQDIYEKMVEMFCQPCNSGDDALEVQDALCCVLDASVNKSRCLENFEMPQ